jgi:hypothetical protein
MADQMGMARPMARRQPRVFTLQVGLMNHIHDRMRLETTVQIGNFIG